MRSKKGFTLIEVIVSMAIFSIALVGISSALNTGNAVYKIENKKQINIAAAQEITQGVKSKGIEKLKDIYGAGPYAVNFYFYYADDSELSAVANNLAMQDFSTFKGTSTNNYRDTTSGDGTYSDCKAKSPNKKYGAWVQVSEYKPDLSGPAGSTDFFKAYKLKVTVWNLIETQGCESSLSVYLSR